MQRRRCPWGAVFVLVCRLGPGFSVVALDCNQNGIPDDLDISEPRLAFNEAGRFSTPALPLSVSLADLDGDHDLDAIAPLERTNDVAILLNRAGALTDPIVLTVDLQVWDVITADLDRDGDLDLAVADGKERSISVPGGPGSITVLVNDGKGRFDPYFQFDLPETPSSITSADIDGDADADLLTTTRGDPDGGVAGALLVLKNEGDGSFADPETFTVGIEPVKVVAAHLNPGDSLDVAVVHNGSGRIAILLNDGRGSLGSAVFVPVWIDPTNGDDVARSGSIAAADIDGDADTDILVPFRSVGGNPRGVSILRNKGNGDFELPVLVNLSRETHPDAMASPTDLDGDGALDLVVTATDSITILFGTESGFGDPLLFPTPGSWVGGFGLGDLDGDDRPDALLVSGTPPGIAFYRNEASPLSRDCNQNAVPDECEIGIGDVCKGAEDCDFDGVDDSEEIAMGDELDCNRNGVPDSCDVTTRIGLGGRRDIPLGPLAYPLRPTPADLDGDGWVDIAVANLFEDLRILWNGGREQLVLSEPIPTEAHAIRVAAADLDGDVDLDLAVGAVGVILQLRNLGSRQFENVDRLPIPKIADRGDPGTTHGIVAADFDRDGDLDLAASNSNSFFRRDVPSNVLVYLNDGVGKLAAPLSFPVAREPAELVAADFDGDGEADLATVCQTLRDPADDSPASVVAVLNGKGTAGFEPAVLYPAGETGYTLLASDLDGDADVDLFATDRSGPHQLLSNLGDGTFDPVPFGAQGQSYGSEVLDIDGDRLSDLAIMSMNDLEVFENRAGAEPWERVQTIKVGTGTRAHVSAADLTGDGRPDLALSNRVTQGIVILRNESRTATSLDANRDGVPDECAGIAFRRGDSGSDGRVNLSDAVLTLRHLFQAGPRPGCLKSGDADDSGRLDLTDAIYLLSYLFQGGPPPAAPLERCGIDLTPDGLSCEAFLACEG